MEIEQNYYWDDDLNAFVYQGGEADFLAVCGDKNIVMIPEKESDMKLLTNDRPIDNREAFLNAVNRHMTLN